MPQDCARFDGRENGPIEGSEKKDGGGTKRLWRRKRAGKRAPWVLR